MVSNPPAGSNKCINCGMSLKPTDKFCTNCGTSVKTDQTNPFVGLDKCPNCGAPVKPQYKYCMSCRTKLPERPVMPSTTVSTTSVGGNIIRCPRCQTELKSNDKFCQKCGYKLESTTDKLPPQTSQSGGVSRFCGNCGSSLKLTAKFCPTSGVKARIPSEQDGGENVESVTRKIDPKLQEDGGSKKITLNENLQASNSKLSQDLSPSVKNENQHQAELLTKTVLEQQQEVARLRMELEKQSHIRAETELKYRQETEAIRTTFERQLRTELENKVQREIETRLQVRASEETRLRQEQDGRLRKDLNSQIRADLQPILVQEIGEKLKQEYEQQLTLLRNQIIALKGQTQDVFSIPEKSPTSVQSEGTALSEPLKEEPTIDGVESSQEIQKESPVIQMTPSIEQKSLTVDVIPEGDEAEELSMEENEENVEESQNTEETTKLEQLGGSEQANEVEQSIENPEELSETPPSTITEPSSINSESFLQAGSESNLKPTEETISDIPFEAIPFPTASNVDEKAEKKKSLGSFIILPDPMAICRFSTHDKISSDKMAEYSFWAIIRTSTSLSVVLPDKNLPDLVNLERGWRLIRFVSPEEGTRYQVLASITIPLLQTGLEIHPLSAYSEDFCLIKETDIETIKKILLNSGLQIKYVE